MPKRRSGRREGKVEKKERAKLFVIGVVVCIGFAVLFTSLVNLQIRGADDYGEAAASMMTKTIYERGSRGQILDVNGALLGYDKKIYKIQFYREPSSKRAQNGAYSKAIWEVIQILKEDGVEVKFDFYLKPAEDGTWYFDTNTTSETVAASREKMFRSNFYVKNTDVNDIYSTLCYNYMIDEIDADFPESEKLTLDDKLQVLSVWQEMQMNAFNSVPIVIAEDVSWASVIKIETRLITLDGISVAVENQRVYPKGTLACHILGYTGKMQTEAQIQNYVAKGYKRSDIIGLDGVEASMEERLTPNSSDRQGYSIVEIDRSGNQIRTLSHQDARDGNTVKLTIDSGLQAVTEQALADLINKTRDFEEQKKLQDDKWLENNKEALMKYQAKDQSIKLAQNGAIVVLDMNCRVKAMASYPNYDPNLFVIGMTPEQRERQLNDPRHPLYNNAISAADTPGSVFKMCTALAALTEGELTLADTIDDGGWFDLYDSTNPPKCWININLRSRHFNQTVVEGLKNSCNYFFYTLGSRLGADGERLYRFAEKLGLTTKTNIDLPGEVTSVVGSQTSLYDPNRPITGKDQDTWYPVQIKTAIKKHLVKIGEKYGYEYSDERLDKCCKALMDMALTTAQGDKGTGWTQAIRPILMEELGMSMELVYKQEVVGDLFTYLNEIKWGGSYTIMTAIGQSITTTTPIAMARYIVAIANGGYVCDVQLIDSIIDPEGNVINKFDEPVIVNDLSEEVAPYISAIKEGMAGVVDEGGTAGDYFSKWTGENGALDKSQLCGKTGTAETSDLDVENNSWFVCFYPKDEPEIAVVVYMPYGFSGARSAEAARTVMEYYFSSRVNDEAVVLPAPNALAQ